MVLYHAPGRPCEYETAVDRGEDAAREGCVFGGSNVIVFLSSRGSKKLFSWPSWG